MELKSTKTEMKGSVENLNRSELAQGTISEPDVGKIQIILSQE